MYILLLKYAYIISMLYFPKTWYKKLDFKGIFFDAIKEIRAYVWNVGWDHRGHELGSWNASTFTQQG